ncbi:MAG TPA: rod shape-determining protein [Candidatus Akkermansia intestinigallinarum]|uniref:Cell shape-determining protein MreB n=1 Tax=Candidatus Akkermansia intestinigallinarum TaxID=2838431 RepID=A0A9D2AGT9_9BACT|nr:rod shape-determining protein [Candidatus Akkermansia intestinigallinarum]
MFSYDIGIDLGTANTLVYVKDQGIVLREPSVVAMKGDKVKAVGEEAKRMLGRTPGSVVAIRPLKEGVIADFDVAQEMLSYFIRKACNRRSLRRPRILIAHPSGITEVERRAIIDSAYEAGASKVQLIEEPMAAAIGVGLPVSEPIGSMIVDIGGGTTEVAIISLSGIVYSQSEKCGGDALDDTICRHMLAAHNLLIGPRTAEDIKISVGSAHPLQQELQMEVKGRDRGTGLPKTVVVRSEEIREALQDKLDIIVNAIRQTLDHCPPELASDLYDRGIMVAGGGALLRGLGDLLHEQTGLPITIADDPLSAVAEGTGKFIQENSRIFEDEN